MIGELTGLIAVVCIFGIPGLWILGKTELGQAIVHRITLGTDGPVRLAELDEVKARLAEVEDRLEFAERQLVDAPGRRPLPPKSEP